MANEARPTLAAVAARAGVSSSTASLAFSGSGPVSAETKQRVLAAAAELDYAGPDPRARSLRRGRSGIIGVVIEDRLRDAFRDPIIIAMLDGLADEVGAIGASLLLITQGEETDGAVESAPVDAVVLFGCSTRVTVSVDVLRRRGIPVVAIEAERLDGVVAIDLDNRPASRLLASKLAELGHRAVAVVTLPLEATHRRGLVSLEHESAATGWVATERLAGVREVFPEAIVWSSAGSFIEEGVLAGRALLEHDAPTAIIAQSDLLAAGVIRAATELGIRVPDDLSVVGFDGVEVDGIELTTIRQPAVDRGRAAGRAVLDLLAGGSPADVGFHGEFVEGSTVGRARVWVH
ncbi:MAG: LacI family transcriptional regulator [Microbacteriaceae bacterium]|nr:LacI family transcriptional regulator [Microbacteriaceae bacterium]